MTSNSRDIQVINNELFINSKVPEEAKCELIEEMKKHFTTEDQLFFVNSFYTYLNYHPTEDFVINLGDVYKWLGFARLDNAKKTLVKKFSEGNDYQISLRQLAELVKVNGGAGLNKEKIMMNIETFKCLCMIAGTEKASEIRSYFLKLESITMSVIKKHLENKNQILFSQDEINNSKRLLEHFGPKGDVFYLLAFKHQEENYAKTGIVRDSRQLHTRYEEHQEEFGEVCLHLVIQCSNINTVENEFKQSSFFRTNKAKILKKYSKKNKPSFHTEILKLSELVTTETIKEKMKSVAGDRIIDPPPVYTEEPINSSLEFEKERTRQMEIQANKEVRIAEIELEKMRLSINTNSTSIIQEEIQEIIQTEIIQEEIQPEETLIEDLELSKNSKVFLLDIVKSYSKTSKFSQIYSSGYNNYHGFSKDFKDHVELDIKNKFELSAIKNNGKIYYIGLKYKNCTSFYNHQVYQQFVDKFVYIPEMSIKLKKIPPGKFMYKIESDKLYSTFCIFTKNLPSIYEKLCSSGHTILYKKEFIEMICSICDVKPPSYTSKTVKYFNGICLK